MGFRPLTSSGGGLSLEQIQAETVSPAELAAATSSIAGDPPVAGELRTVVASRDGWVSALQLTPPIATGITAISMGKVAAEGGGSSARQTSFVGNDGKLYFVDETARIWQCDPATKIWTKKATRPGNHDRQAVAPLADGRALFIGGRLNGSAGGGYATTAVHIYNPSTDSFTQVADLPLATMYGSAALLDDGNVIYAGGNDPMTNDVAFCRLYNVAGNSWSTLASLGTANSIPMIAALPGAKLFAYYAPPILSVLDVASNTWTPIANPLNLSSQVQGIGSLGGGRIIIANSSVLGPIIYDHTTGSWGYVPHPSYNSAFEPMGSRASYAVYGNDLLVFRHSSASNDGSRSQWIIRNGALLRPVYFVRKS